ncbi:MAG: hypothetical protein ACRDPW_00645, partial [Mycobacteriales bacterium]
TKYGTATNITLAIFESIESTWFREVPPKNDTDTATAPQPPELAHPPEPGAKPSTETEPTSPEPGPAADAPEDAAAQAPTAPIRARFPMPSAQIRHTGTASVRPEWRSAGDVGWQRAVAAASPRTGGMTEAGLPKRIPMANYIPGGVRTAAQIAAAAAPLNRSPEAIGAGLSSYRRGVERGRQAGTSNSSVSLDDSASLHDTNQEESS